MAEQDITFNKVNLALARSQRLLESWLPPPSESELASAKTDAELEAEEAETFKPMPDLLGVGGKLPEDVGEGDFRRNEISSNDRLRKQLLGNDYKKYGLKPVGKDGKALPAMMGSKPKPMPAKREVPEDESEEEGRSALGKSRKKQKMVPEAATGSAKVDGDSEEEESRSSKPARGPKSFLDEMLQKSANKKKKKKNKNKSE